MTGERLNDPKPRREAPLAGVRIIDLTVAIAGPVATQLLADLGADVIRIEPPFPRPLHVDIAPARSDAAGAPSYNRIVSYNDLQRGKRAITLDLARPAGRDLLLRLVETSDVVVENMSPRVLPSLGLAYAELRAHRPDIILVSMPAFGATGPLRDRVSYGPGIDAMSGLSHLTGYPDRGPMQPANYYCDYNAGALAAFATIAALRHRARTGGGQHVECAMLEGELQCVGEALMDYAMNNRTRHRAGNAHPTMSPHGVYPAAADDRWLAIACETDAQWRSLCDVMREPALAARYADVVSRVRARDLVDAAVSVWTSTQDDAVATAAALQAVGVPAAAVNRISDLFDEPQLRARSYLRSASHPEAEAMPFTRPAFAFTSLPQTSSRPAPKYGEHNTEILRNLLGLTEEEIATLAADRVIAHEPPSR